MHSHFSTCFLALTVLANSDFAAASAAGEPWLSPVALATTRDESALFVACGDGKQVLRVDLATGKVTASWPAAKPPTGMALSPDGQTLAVTCGGPESEVLLMEAGSGKVRRKLRAGHTAMAPVFSPEGEKLYVCNRFNNEVAVLDTASGKTLARILVKREPFAAAITRDGRRLLVANHLPATRADANYVAAVVSVIDTESARVLNELPLPSGSTGVNDITVSPDGRHAVVTHVLARYHLPTTQPDRGWINTNAKTVIGLDPLQVINTVLLDSVDLGAANPWGTAWSADSKTLVVTHAGTHEVSVINFPALLEKLAKEPAPSTPAASNVYPSGGGPRGSQVPNNLAYLLDLRVRRRLPDGDLGPRAVAVAGNRAYVANFFSDTLSVVELSGKYAVRKSIALGPKPVLTAERRGELHFHDARICFQQWHSCASCHPGDARVDGLNWDLLNDGIGNPKNNKSMLLSHKTPPAMSTGARETAETAVRAGIKHILFTVQPEEVANDIDAYLKSLKPVPSPLLVKGRLSASARRGEKLFHSVQVGCASCHPRPLLTDLQAYDVGTQRPADREVSTFDTPTLVELWRTAPYLHDGSAATIREVLVERNAGDQHGKTSHLTADQIGDLCEYLLSL